MDNPTLSQLLSYAAKRGMNDFNIKCFRSADLAAVNGIQTPHRTDFDPDFWVFVARCTVGSLVLYMGDQRSEIQFRLDSGSLVLPVSAPQMTVECLTATGWYMLYAVKKLDGFKVSS